MRKKVNILKASATSLAAVALLLFSACHSDGNREREPVTLRSMGIRPDSLISPQMTAIITDNCVQISNEKICQRLAIKPLDRTSLYIDSPDSLLCRIFNLRIEHTQPSDTLPAGMASTAAWITSALTSRTLPANLLESNNIGYHWPVAATDFMPALVAFDVADMTDDNVLRARCATLSSNLLTLDNTYARDKSTELYRGASAAFITLRRPSANAAQYAGTYSLSANLERIAVMKRIAEATGDARFTRQADSLAIAVETFFRMPARGSFCEALYQTPYPIAFNGSDNLAQGMGIAMDIFRPEVAEMLAARAPLRIEREDALPALAAFWPEVDGLPNSYHDLCAACWSIAASRVGNSQVFSLAFGNLMHRAVSDSVATELLRGAVIRGIFGIKTTRDYLTIAPYLPTGLAGHLTLHNFRYRNATLDIHLSGNGNIISTVTLDGEVVDKAVIPEGLSGHHEMHIHLVGETSGSNELTEASAVSLPKIQITKETDNKVLHFNGADRYAVYVNGRLDRITDNEIYNPAAEHIPGDRLPEFISIVPIGDDDCEGFSPEAFIYSADSQVTIIDADKVANPGTRAFKDKKLDRLHGREFVESTHHRNPTLRLEVNSKSGGKAYLSVIYIDGLGIVNPGLRYALRSVEVNGQYAGVLVFPQLNPDRWDHRVKWWERRAETLPIEVVLQPGVNEVAISYFALPLTGLRPDANILLPIRFIITE